ncbi:MAG: Asp-tRNA(Asn)/Glu-tRNA(Gln) amidotransferase GatCAB subunit A [Bacillota bacterium]|nr:MAG: Asp-tRNA(Asn)/Glu-tRNA(Gln) amidotransferase GatCAB subunit A [Bacillota bacterium]
MELHDLTVRELRQRLAAKEVSSAEVTEHVLRRIEQLDPHVGAYLTVTADQALAAAKAADEARARGEAVHPLAGVPGGLKDNIVTEGVRTTAGSRVLENWTPPYDATVVRRLKDAGVPVLGKTNMDEFAMGSSTETSAFKKTRNPWDAGRAPGGSSGGSAAAVAAGMGYWALGSDTGGSIRQPAAFCGVVGMKPTYGLVSRFGLIAMASSLDQIGPFTRDVADAAELLNVIAGHDPKDSTSAPGRAPDFTAALKAEAKGLRIGLPKEYFTEGISAEVQAAVRQAAAELERAGATVEEVSLPHAEYALGAYYMIVSAESSSNLGRYDGVRYGRREAGADVPAMMTATRALLGSEVKRRIVLGTFVRGKERLPEYYMRAARVRTLLRRDFEQAFEKVDVLLTPVTPTTAFPLGRRVRSQMEAYAADICTVAVNLAGLPALSMPCGVGADGLPIGLQFIGPAFGDAQVLQAAYTYEQLAWPEGAGRAWRAGKEVDVDGH